MDWYYVKGGERIGPISEPRLAELRRDGTITAETLLWSAGMREWQPCSALFPDEPAPGAAGIPPALPATGHGIPEGGPSGAGGPSFPDTGVRGDPAELAAVEYEVRIGDCLSRAWAMLTGPKFGPLFGAGAMVYAIYFGAANIPIVGTFVGLFAWVLFGGLYQYYLRHIRGPEPPFDYVFCGFRCQMGPLILISLIQIAALAVCLMPALLAFVVAIVAQEEAILVAAGVLTGLGFIAWFLIYVIWGFGPILCLDKGLGPWAAMETSRKVVFRHWPPVLLFSLLTFVIAMAGALVFCVGILFTFPLASLAWAFLYHDVFDRELPRDGTSPR